MPPQNKERCLKIDITQAAAPFNAPVYEINERVEKKDNGSQETTPSTSQMESDDYHDNSTLRITTRARHTYELDRFSKNAMLIIDNKSYLNGESIDLKLDEAFQKYRFEVQKYVNLTQEEIIATCERFFSQDFSEYGAIAIAVLAKMDRNGDLVASDVVFKESIVTNNITVNLPTTLTGKPIIYITEVADFYTKKRVKLNYPDIVSFHIPISVVSYSHPMHFRHQTPRPLQILSDNILNNGDKKSLMDIMTLTVTDIINTWFFYYNHPIHISSTLRKELTLVKS